MDRKKIIRVTAQVLTSASLISCGIIAGVTPVGAMLAFTGVCLAFAQEDMTPEEYNEAVRAHFAERGAIRHDG